MSDQNFRQKIFGIASRFLPFAIGLYGVAVLTSMAGMEMFAGLSMLSVLLILMLGSERRSFSVKLVDGALMGLVFVSILGVLVNTPEPKSVIDIIGRARWPLVFCLVRFGLLQVWPVVNFAKFKIYLGVASFMALYGIIQFPTGIDLVHREQGANLFVDPSTGAQVYRSSGFFGSPMTYGHSMVLCFSVALGFVLYLIQQRKVRTQQFAWTAGGALLMGLSLLTTLTRGVWLAAIASGLVMSAYVGRRLLLKVSGVMVAGLGSLIVISHAFRDRVMSIFDLGFRSNADRLVLWKTNFKIWLDYPLLGVGTGENERVIVDYYQRAGMEGYQGHAHNNLIQFLSGNGVLGLTCFLIFAVGFFVISHRLWRRIPVEHWFERSLVLGVMGAQVALQVGGMTECNFKDAEVNHLFLFLLALIFVLNQKYLLGQNGASLQSAEGQI